MMVLLRCHARSLLLTDHQFDLHTQELALQYSGLVKYLQPTTVWSQTHSLRHQFGKDTIWREVNFCTMIHTYIMDAASMQHVSYKLGLTASQVLRLIGMLLVFANSP